MRKYGFWKKKRKKGSKDPGRHRWRIRIGGYCLGSSLPLKYGGLKERIFSRIGYRPDDSSKISTFDRDRRTGSWWKMLSVLMKTKNSLILYTVPVLSFSASLVVPVLGLGWCMRTLDPILILSVFVTLSLCFWCSFAFVFVQCWLGGLWRIECVSLMDGLLGLDLMEEVEWGASTSSTLDRDLLTGLRLKMLSVSMEMKNLLVLNTFPVLSVLASLVFPALGLWFLILTIAPIQISLMLVSPVCFSLILPFQCGVTVLFQCPFWPLRRERAFLVGEGFLELERMMRNCGDWSVVGRCIGVSLERWSPEFAVVINLR